MARRRRRRADGPSGILLIDKPVGPTSRDVVNDLRRRLDLPGPGHCGTLDPLASGLLVLVSGWATRIQDRLTGHDKSYEASVLLGATSVTDDAEGPVSVNEEAREPTREEIEEAVARFVGEIDQLPPAYSAIRVDGERLYKSARRGEVVEIPTRRVRIDSVTVLQYDWPHVDLVVDCGPGTYIRSLARDLGEQLGCGAYLNGLRRTRSGDFRIEDAVPLDVADATHVRPLEDLLASWSALEIPPGELSNLLAGKEIRVTGGHEVHDDALVVCEGLVVGRARKLSESTLRLRRLIRNPRDESTA